MRFFPFDYARPVFFQAPEHGGTNIKGGGHPADSNVPAEEEILDATGQAKSQRGNTPGTGDAGVP